MLNVGKSAIQSHVQRNAPLSIPLKIIDGSSDTSDLPEARQEGGAHFCQPCAPAAATFGFGVEPMTEFDARVFQLLELNYTMDAQEISAILMSVGGDLQTAEAILRAKYMEFDSPAASDNCNQSSDDYGDWHDETPEGSLPDLIEPEMKQGDESMGVPINFHTYIIEDHPITSSYSKYEFWERTECERFLRSELWKIADVNLKWMHPLWTLHQVFSFLVLPTSGLEPEWFHNPMNNAEKRAREDWITLVTYPLPQFQMVDMPRTERIDYPLTLRGSFEAPSTSSYVGGKFKIRLMLPCGFPMKPPLVYFDTPIFHPSYDHDGEFLIDPSKWNQKLCLRDVIEHISTLLRATPTDGTQIIFSASEEITTMWKTNSDLFALTAATWTQRLAS